MASPATCVPICAAPWLQPPTPPPHRIRRVDALNEDPMQDTSARNTRNKLARIYGLGILAFTVIVGFVTLLVKFLANVDMM
jgi:hypothetical protein